MTLSWMLSPWDKALSQRAQLGSLSGFGLEVIYHHQAQGLGFPGFRFSTGQVFNVAEVYSGRTETPWTIEL